MGILGRTRAVVLAATLAVVTCASAQGPAGAEGTAPDPGIDRVLTAVQSRDLLPLVDELVIPKAGLGFADGMKLVQMSPEDLEKQLEAVALTSARWLRVPFNWSLIESTRGVYDWSQVDRVVDRARAHGLKVLANLAYAPAWARTSRTTGTGPPRAGRAYGAFAGAATHHFAGRVKHFEIWNEPNFAKFFGGPATHAHAPEKYTRLLKKASRAIKAESRRSVVVAGALAPGMDTDETYSMPTFVSRMYDAGARRFFDAMSLHPYTTTSPASWDRVYGDVTEVRELMRAHKNGRRKIWYTEFGHTSPLGGLSEVAQAAWVVKELAAAAARPYVGPAFLYAIRDSGTDRTEYGQNFGTLLTYDFRPKVLATVLSVVTLLP